MKNYGKIFFGHFFSIVFNNFPKVFVIPISFLLDGVKCTAPVIFQTYDLTEFMVEISKVYNLFQR